MIDLDTLASTPANFEKLREFAKKQQRALGGARTAADNATRRCVELRDMLTVAEQTHAKQIADLKGMVALRDSDIETLQIARTRDETILRECQQAAARQDTARVREIETAQAAVAAVTKDRDALARRIRMEEKEDRDLKTLHRRLQERGERVVALEARLKAVEEGDLLRQTEDLKKRLQVAEDALRAGQDTIDTARQIIAHAQVGNRLASTCP